MRSRALTVLSWVLIAVGCYGALFCAFASGLLGAVFSAGWQLNPWDVSAIAAWWHNMGAVVVEQWPWLIAMALCLGCATLGGVLYMQDDAAAGSSG
ncbi:MAG: hypothetical protein FGM15_05545 [Chthoniobacterales bacterium]|nr:hypothetical protein [Chthoniobacterales bacterium]